MHTLFNKSVIQLAGDHSISQLLTTEGISVQFEINIICLMDTGKMIEVYRTKAQMNCFGSLFYDR